ncbi:hypothetical protein [Lentzea atacamensis]|nr:hypothetical protein [Lentzea atacamensis]
MGPGRLDLFTVGRAAASRGPNRIDGFITAPIAGCTRRPGPDLIG